MLKELFSAWQSERDGGYDWSELKVYRHPRESRKYIVVSQGGCSCNSFEAPSVREAEGMTPLGKREVVAKFSKWFDRSSYLSNNGTKIDNLARLRASL